MLTQCLRKVWYRQKKKKQPLLWLVWITFNQSQSSLDGAKPRMTTVWRWSLVFSKWLSPCKRREKGPWRNSFFEFGVAELDVPAWSPNLDPIWHHLDELEHQLQVWPRHNPASLMSLEASAWFQYFADCHRGVEAAAAAKRAPTPY